LSAPTDGLNGGRVNPTIREMAEAFSRHQFDATYPFILEKAEWTLVGGEQIRGKADIVRTCEESVIDMKGVETTFTRFKVIPTDDSVVVDSRAEYVDDSGESSHVASCDIYEFIDGNIAAITSYMVGVPPDPSGS